MKKVFIILSLFLSSIWAQDIQVSYLSQEYVYLNAGSQAGLSEGDIVSVLQTPPIELEVLFTSQYSSACRMLTQGTSPKAGDIIYIKNRKTRVDTPNAIVRSNSPTPNRQSEMRINGYFNSYMNSTISDPALQPNYGNSLKVALKSIAGIHDLGFLFRGSARSFPSSSSVSSNQKIDQAEIFFLPNQENKLKIGRIIPNDVAYVGVIDGAQGIYVLTHEWTLGGIAGSTPEQYYDYLEHTQKTSLYAKWEQITTDSFASMLVGVLHESNISNNNINTVFINSSIPNILNWNLNISTLYGNVVDGGPQKIKQGNFDGTYNLSKTIQTGFNGWYDSTYSNYYGLRFFGLIKDTLSQTGLSAQVRRSNGQNTQTLSLTYQAKNSLLPPSNFNTRADWSWASDFYSLSWSTGIQKRYFDNHDLSIRLLTYYYYQTSTDTSWTNPSLQVMDEISMATNWDISITAEQYFGTTNQNTTLYLNNTFYF